jgi:glutamate synthase (NADPH/NADH) small chain
MADHSSLRIAVIGAGPAGLAAAQQLARMGHDVVVFEKDESAGGLLRYGIPDFKLDKKVIDRRLEQLVAEGVDFQTGVEVGVDISVRYLRKMFDAVCLTMGAGKPRDLVVDGRGYENILFAMDYLSAQNKTVAGEKITDAIPSAMGKNVVVIGGGDTGSDCVGTARRQGANNIYQLEILPKPPADRPADTPWPMWPRIMRQSTSHEEGCERMWSVTTQKFTGDDRRVRRIHCCNVEWENVAGNWKLKEIEGSEFAIDADLVLLAMGFVHVVHSGLVETLDVELDERGNVKAENFQATEPWIFTAGDTATGASLVVRAIDSGRKMAKAVDVWLAG